MLKVVNPARSEPSVARSQTSMAYARLKSDLLSGRVFPGEKLKINELALQLTVSPGAIREALSRLVPEGLVISRDQKGFVVAPLSIDDLKDLTRLRCDIEELALRHSLAAITVDGEITLITLGHRLRRTPRKLPLGAPNPDWVALHEMFHQAFVSACGSPRLLALHAQLYQQSERYRIMSAHVDLGRDVESEHQALVEAALSRDADALVRLTKEHFQLTTDLMVQAAERSQELHSEFGAG